MRTVLAAVFALATVPLAATAAPFDGRWSVTVECPRTPSGVAHYAYDFSATVTSGALHGEHGKRGLPSYLAIDGRIADDGTVGFHANGIVGLPDTALKHRQTGTPYAYDAVGKFEGGHGSARRTTGRQCDYRFRK